MRHSTIPALILGIIGRRALSQRLKFKLRHYPPPRLTSLPIHDVDQRADRGKAERSFKALPASRTSRPRPDRRGHASDGRPQPRSRSDRGSPSRRLRQEQSVPGGPCPGPLAVPFQLPVTYEAPAFSRRLRLRPSLQPRPPDAEHDVGDRQGHDHRERMPLIGERGIEGAGIGLAAGDPG